MKRERFTLVELLVVIAIIGILTSMLLPSLSEAREKARISVCLSNIKQASVIYMMYSDEYDSRFNWQNWYHDNYGMNPNDKESLAQERLLNLFVDTRKLAECPSDKGDSRFNTSSSYQRHGTSYYTPFADGSHKNLHGVETLTTNSSDGTLSRHISYFQNTSEKMMITEMSLWPTRPLTDGRNRWHYFNTKRKKNTVLYLDGHAKFLSLSPDYDSISLRAPVDPDRWGFY